MYEAEHQTCNHTYRLWAHRLMPSTVVVVEYCSGTPHAVAGPIDRNQHADGREGRDCGEWATAEGWDLTDWREHTCTARCS